MFNVALTSKAGGSRLRCSNSEHATEGPIPSSVRPLSRQSSLLHFQARCVGIAAWQKHPPDSPEPVDGRTSPARTPNWVAPTRKTLAKASMTKPRLSYAGAPPEQDAPGSSFVSTGLRLGLCHASPPPSTRAAAARSPVLLGTGGKTDDVGQANVRSRGHRLRSRVKLAEY